jgi:hypothetical protein
VDVVRARRAATAVVTALALLLVAACSSQGDRVRDYLRDAYGDPTRAGDSETFRADVPVGTATERIVDRVDPAARQADGGNEYLRYDEDIVIVSPAAGGGSTIRVEDLDDGFRGGAFVFLGPGFRPGSPARGTGGSFGGGPGSGK